MVLHAMLVSIQAAIDVATYLGMANKSNCGRPPQPKQAVRQLLAVINEFLLFRFKGFKCFLFVTFYSKIELSDSLFRVGRKSPT